VPFKSTFRKHASGEVGDSANAQTKMMKNEEAVPMMMSAKIGWKRSTFYSRQALYALGTARRPSCYWLASYRIDSFDNASQALLDDLFCYLANSP